MVEMMKNAFVAVISSSAAIPLAARTVTPNFDLQIESRPQ